MITGRTSSILTKTWQGLALAIVPLALALFSLGQSYSLRAAEVLLYSNDFDGNVFVRAGATAVVTPGGTTNESVQNLAGIGGFSGNLQRIDNINDLLTIDLSGIPAHTSIRVAFDIAFIDSWDGNSASFGPDFFNLEMTNSAGNTFYDLEETYGSNGGGTLGALIPAAAEYTSGPTQLGWNLGTQFWWSGEAYDFGLFPDLEFQEHSSSGLTLEFFASGAGFQGGFDESFAIDNLRIYLAPEPHRSILILLGLLTALSRRQR